MDISAVFISDDVETCEASDGCGGDFSLIVERDFFAGEESVDACSLAFVPLVSFAKAACSTVEAGENGVYVRWREGGGNTCP